MQRIDSIKTKRLHAVSHTFMSIIQQPNQILIYISYDILNIWSKSRVFSAELLNTYYNKCFIYIHCVCVCVRTQQHTQILTAESPVCVCVNICVICWCYPIHWHRFCWVFQCSLTTKTRNLWQTHKLIIILKTLRVRFCWQKQTNKTKTKKKSRNRYSKLCARIFNAHWNALLNINI